MGSILIGILVFAVMLTLMAVGVIFGRKPLKGTCGGLNQLAADQGESKSTCEVCGKQVSEENCQRLLSISKE